MTRQPHRKDRPTVTVGEMSRRLEEIRSGKVKTFSRGEIDASFERKITAAAKRQG